MGGADWLGEPWEVRFFEKCVPESWDEGSEKVRKKDKNWSDPEVSKGIWAFLGGKLIAGGLGRGWSQGEAKNRKEKFKNRDFGVSGVDGGSAVPIFPVKGSPYRPLAGSAAWAQPLNPPRCKAAGVKGASVHTQSVQSLL